MSPPPPPIPWQTQLQTALTTANPNLPTTSMLAQLSTIRGPSTPRYAGRPAVRTINIRRITSSSLFFITDTRSGKYQDIHHASSPHAELCCYFPKSQIQFRISGVLTFLPHSHPQSQQVWASLYDGQRKWWTWPTPAEDRLSDEDFQRIEPGDTAPENFCVGRLDPDLVDVLDLTSAPFMREIHELSTNISHDADVANSNVEAAAGKWKAKRVNP